MTKGEFQGTMNRLLVIMGIACILLLNNCSENTSPIREDSADPAINEQAMLMDIYLTDAIRPSLDYYHRICRDMKSIHRKYDDEYSHVLNVGFRFAYTSNSLTVKFDETTAALVDSMEYTAWDSLNIEYGVNSYRKGLRNRYYLYFECCSHMKYVADLYRELPGIEYVSKNWMSLPNSGVYPRTDGDTMLYYFERPEYCVDWNLCYGYKYLYIKTYDRQVELLGYWNTREEAERPAWFREAVGIYNDWWYYFYDY